MLEKNDIHSCTHIDFLPIIALTRFDHYQKTYNINNMASWGTKTFEDDTATDWLAELIEAEETREFLLANISIKDGAEPGYDTGVICVAACEIIVALIDEPRRGLPEELKDWLGENECDDITDLPEKAQESLNIVLRDNSELMEIWKDQEDYDEWREGVDELAEIMEQLVQA